MDERQKDAVGTVLMNILIVEDERRLAHLLRRVLLEERHTAELAFDGREGLQLALGTPFDLVILDLMLPGMDGLEICRQLRASGGDAPVLMLTARGAVEDRVAGLNAGRMTILPSRLPWRNCWRAYTRCSAVAIARW